MTVYYLRADNGAIKIGHSGNADKRISQISVTSPLDLKMVAHEHGTLKLERKRHEQFKEAHIRGEWFYPCDALNNHIKSLNPDYTPLVYVGIDDYHQMKKKWDWLISWFTTDKKDPPKIAYLVMLFGLLGSPLLMAITKNNLMNDEASFVLISLVISPILVIVFGGYALVKVWQFRIFWKDVTRVMKKTKMYTHLTNSTIKRMAKQIERNLNKNSDIVLRIKESDHPQAQQIIEALENEGFLYNVEVESVIRNILSGEK